MPQNEWRPTPKQETALARTEFEVLFGGARGGGKSEALLAVPLYHAGNPNYRGLVIRRNAVDLSDFVGRAEAFYSQFFPGTQVVGKPGSIRFPSGAIIDCGHMKDKDSFSKYQGWQRHFLGIEELTQIPNEEWYERLLTSVRSPHAEIIPQVFCTTNPDGPGHKWVKRRWKINEVKDGVPFADEHGNTRVFVSALLSDNPYLMGSDPEYAKRLEQLPEVLKQQWLNGSWDDFDVAGSVYNEYVREMKEKGRLCQVAHDPLLPVFTVWDLGMSDSMVVGFFQKYRDEIRWIDTISLTDTGFEKLIPMVLNKPYSYGAHFAPHDIRVREMGSGKTRLEVAQSLGISFQIAKNVPLADGISAVKAIFGRLWADDAKNAEHLETLRSYHKEWNEAMRDWEAEPVHDWSSHVADMIRYMALSEHLFTDAMSAPAYIGDGRYAEGDGTVTLRRKAYLGNGRWA